MYRWIWHHLPAGRARPFYAAALLALVVALLWLVVFPAVAPRLPLDRVAPAVTVSATRSAAQ